MEQEPLIIGTSTLATREAIEMIEAIKDMPDNSIVVDDTTFHGFAQHGTAYPFSPMPFFGSAPILKYAPDTQNPRKPLTPKQVEKRKKKNQAAKKARKITRNQK